MPEFINEYELIIFDKLNQLIKGEQNDLFSESLPDNLYDLCLEIIKKENDKGKPEYNYTRLW
jgi:hypothetical protein